MLYHKHRTVLFTINFNVAWKGFVISLWLESDAPEKKVKPQINWCKWNNDHLCKHFALKCANTHICANISRSNVQTTTFVQTWRPQMYKSVKNTSTTNVQTWCRQMCKDGRLNPSQKCKKQQQTKRILERARTCFIKCTPVTVLEISRHCCQIHTHPAEQLVPAHPCLIMLWPCLMLKH